jgi:hypothetical protein
MKKRLILILTALLSSTVCLQAQRILDGKPVKVFNSKVRSRAPKAANSDKFGVQSTLKYEKIADMKLARNAHQTFPSGNGFIVVGGYNEMLEGNKSAELWQDGKWKTVSLVGATDPIFSVTLSDGRVMVGGGRPSGAGVGHSKATSIYNPTTQTFTKGPDMTIARSMCKGLLIGNNVYISGNWQEEDKVFDRYDGTNFQSYGQKTLGHSAPYLLFDSNNMIYILSLYDNNRNQIASVNYNNQECFPFSGYDIVNNESYTTLVPLYSEYHLLDLPDEIRSSDYYIPLEEMYLMMTKKDDGNYYLSFIDFPEGYVYLEEEVMIPTKHPTTGNTITWRGGVYWNEAKKEGYIIGSSGTGGNRSVHIISIRYNGITAEAWSMATADGFNNDLNSAAWTLLSDGRLACSGGMNASTYQPVKDAYIFAPPMAGTKYEAEDAGTSKFALVVLTKDNKQHEFRLAGSKPQVMFEATSLKIIMASKIEAEFAFSDIIRFYYVNLDPSGIDDLSIDQNPTEIGFQEDGVLVISQMKEGAVVNIYGMDGKVITQFTAKHAGSCRLNLSPLPKGVYIVKADNITYKIMKR